MVWHADWETIDPASRRATLSLDDEPASFGHVVERLTTDESLHDLLIDLLRDTPFPAYFWELPALSDASRADPFEFVVVDSPVLAALKPDWRPFGEHFGRDQSPAIAFKNLSGRSDLIVPRPLDRSCEYTHLGAFARSAPRGQQHTRCGVSSASRWVRDRDGHRSGSARAAPGCIGCTFGSTITRSTTRTGRTGRGECGGDACAQAEARCD